MTDIMLKAHSYRIAFSLLLSIALSGCASNSVWTPYPRQVSSVLYQLQTPQPLKMNPTFESGGADGLLHALEHARITHILGQRDSSLKAFSTALASIEDDNTGAMIRFGNVGREGLALISNDNARTYRGEIYERIFAHHFQALNYLLKGDLKGAGVEARRLSRVQNDALQTYTGQLQLEQASDSYQQNTVDLPQFTQMDRAAADINNAVQNAASYYLSGLIYELSGDAQDARIDYQNALSLQPYNVYIQAALQGLLRKKRQSAQLIIFYEQGFVPAKKEVRVSIPHSQGIISIALPLYQHFQQHSHLTVSENRTALGQSQLLSGVSNMAAYALKDQRTSMIARQIGRAIAKTSAQRLSYREGGLLGAVVTNLYTALSENADLRSWLSLPNNIQIFSHDLSAGTHTLQLRNALGKTQTLNLSLTAGQVHIVQVVDMGQRFYVHRVVY